MTTSDPDPSVSPDEPPGTLDSSASKGLLAHRGFNALFWTQFLGAFNDNLFKNALVLTLTFGGASQAGMTPEQLVAMAGGVFILPFFLLSAFAGQLADKYPKGLLIRYVKVAEIGVMVLAAVGFLFESTVVLFLTLFLMGLQSALFGPLKYGVLPELLPLDKLVGGNALVEMGTFLAILLGTIAGGLLIAAKAAGSASVGAAAICVAVLGWLSARRVPRGDAAAPDLRIARGVVRPTLGLLAIARQPPSVFNSILGISWFWLLGSCVLSLLPGLVTKHLGGDETVVTYVLALFSIGVAAGSLLCERLSFQQLELGLVPIGSVGITVFLFDVAFNLGPASVGGSELSIQALLATSAGVRVSISLSLFSIASGLFIVPLYTLLQERSDPQGRARVIAANNVANALFMVAGSLLLMGLHAMGAGIPHILGLLALLNLAVAVYIYTLIPEFLFRFICFLLAHVLYRLRVTHREAIPMTGPVVLVCNHITFIDWLVISAACQRPIRFVMHHSFLKLPMSGWFFRAAKVIPIAGAKEDPEILEAAFARIAEELEAGEAVCIFPEGKLTPDGQMHPFRSGIERIIDRTPVPVVPMHLHGLWESIFSYYKDKRPFRRIWSRVRLVVGNPVAPEQVSASGLEEEVRRLGGLRGPTGAPDVPAAVAQ